MTEQTMRKKLKEKGWHHGRYGWSKDKYSCENSPNACYTLEQAYSEIVADAEEDRCKKEASEILLG